MRLRLAVLVVMGFVFGLPSPATAAEQASVTLTNVEMYATGASGTEVASVDVVGTPVHLVCPLRSKFVCLNPSTGNTATVNIDFGLPLVDVTQLCIVFHFADDLVDPGEEVLITFEHSSSIANGIGNVGGSAVAQQTACITDPRVLAGFLAGEETGYVFVSRSSAARAGLGCGDDKHLHERGWDCVAA
jgi:hypothetical protein